MGRDELTPLRRRNPKVTPALARAIERALAVRPEERYQTVAEFAASLSTASRASQPTLVRDYPHLDRTVQAPITAGFGDLPTRLPWEEEKPRRWPYVVVPLLVITAVAAGAVMAGPERFFGGSPTEPPTEAAQTTAPPTEAEVVLEPQPSPTIVLPSATPLPTVDPSLTLTPAPTPIGGGIGQLAFASNRSGIPQIYLINIDGTGLEPLTNLADGACQPAWSPDGQALVFTSPCPDSQETYPGAGLWILELESLELAPLVTAPGGDYDPAWSPEGDRIAFASERLGRPQVMVIDLDDELAANVSQNTFRELQPVWSSQGTALLFVSYRNGFAQVWLMSDGGENEQRFARGDLEDSHPVWSPDGSLVVFQRRISGVPRLVAAQFEDRGVPDFRVCQQSPYTSQPMVEPDFSPDGRWLVVETWPDGINHNIAIMTTSCASVTVLSDDPAVDFDPAWRP